MDYRTFSPHLFILKSSRTAFASKSTKNFLDQWGFLTAVETVPGFSCCASPFAFTLFPVSSLQKKSSLFLLCALSVIIRAKRLFAD